MAKPPRSRGLSSFSDTPIGKPPGVGYWWGREVLTESLGKSYPWTVRFLFGNTELSLALWNVIAGIFGLDDYYSFRYLGVTFTAPVK